jgi:hydroxymethylbilane synthase
MRTIRIATRKSPLALWQAEFVAQQICQLYPRQQVELCPMVTQGDRILDSPLSAVGGKGLFVKELEQAMYEGRADLAVHSMKDVPMDLPPGMQLPVIFPREDPLDAFVSNNFQTLDDLPQGARLGTSSLRRRSQLLAARPDLDIRDLRGNVNTRLGKLDAGDFDAIVLAKAGLIRLGMAERISSSIHAEVCLPAVGQGAVGIEIRQDDGELAEWLKPLSDEVTTCCVLAERAMGRELQGNCQVPVAGHARLTGDQLELTGVVADLTGNRVLKVIRSASVQNADALGREVAAELRKQGADQILAQILAKSSS